MSKSDDYWKTRKSELLSGLLDDMNLDNLNRLYASSSQYMNESIKKIFDRYKSKYGLSEAEAKRLLNSLKDDTDYKELLRELKNNPNSESRKELLKVLEAPAYAYRIQRLQEAQLEIDNIVKRISNKEVEFNTLNYIDMAHESYYKNMYEMQKGLNLSFGFNKVNPKVVHKLLNSKWFGKNYSERIWNNTQDLAHDVKRTILEGVLTGKSYSDMSNVIQERFLSGRKQARRLVFTESAFVANSMDIEVYKECSIKTLIFVATLDLKTSDLCREHDGKKVDVDKVEIGVNVPPLHAWCRSVTRAFISDALENTLQRRARNPFTGEIETFSNITYDEWLQRLQGEYGHDAVEVLQKKVTNLGSDKKQYEKYKEVLSDNSNMKSLDSFQDLKYKTPEQWAKVKHQYSVENKAKSLLMTAKEKEPTITSDLSSAVDKYGGHLEGLDFRLKGQGSLVRKMNSDLKAGSSLSEVSNSMYDLVRYTSVSTPDNLTTHYFNVVDDLKEKGYNMVRVKNTLGDLESDYRGLNCVVEDGSGYNFELQFHTPQSLEIKETNHLLYEEQRLDTTSYERKMELFEQMANNLKDLITPDDIDKIISFDKTKKG